MVREPVDCGFVPLSGRGSDPGSSCRGRGPNQASKRRREPDGALPSGERQGTSRGRGGQSARFLCQGRGLAAP